MKILHAGRHILNFNRPLIMGVLNITPDSFSDGGRYANLNSAIAQAEAMLLAGADILDIGGESTRPGATAVPADEECARVLPILKALSSHGVPLSLDTQKAAVMQRVLAETDLDLVNDISALEDDSAMALIAQSSVGVCLMHKNGNPVTMQTAPQYANVVTEVANYLNQRVTACLHAGIAQHRLCVDAGFGFGKTLAHNLDLLRHLADICPEMPMLAGLSRKSMLGALCNEPEPSQRLGASVAAALIAVQNGANIVRVHDVAATRQALQVWAAL
jgi:dihydropteroate synthase